MLMKRPLPLIAGTLLGVVALTSNAAIECPGLMPGFLNPDAEIKLAGDVKGAESQITLNLTIDGKTFSGEFNPDGSGNVHIDVATGIAIGSEGTIPYSLTITAGSETKDMSGNVLCGRHNAFIEEGTGTWCGYCPKGIIAMAAMRERHPDHFIGISVHQGGNDPMANPEYPYAAQTPIPHCRVNRDAALSGGPLDMESFYARAMQQTQQAAIVLSADFNAQSNEVDVTSSFAFLNNHNRPKFRISYILAENDVHHPENNKYAQTNAYSGGAEGETGGYENMPERISPKDMWYQEVGRCQIGGYDGIEGSVPNVLTAGNIYTHETSFALPDNVDDIDKCYVVAVLIDIRDNKVIASGKHSLSNENSGIKSVSGDSKGNLAERISVRAGGMDIPDEAIVYDIAGRRCDPSFLTSGIYIVTNGRESIKIAIR